ncbi:TetR/AcrR family transcriptional regulator [Dictyobacter aurantiacus]|uniref:TetR/AcrR family transcriptional regulator n=1 Tax=Dictyobacter aurantiacus TaxID=1936993 RepID=UPI001F1F093C|nr:helix-turn-helix domain-containing protein [Dictyobacter aurantiacus]
MWLYVFSIESIAHRYAIRRCIEPVGIDGPWLRQPVQRRELIGAERQRMRDHRVRRSKERVLRATAELLTENGLGGVSVEEVFRRSGVAKTTIYRHWAIRADLMIDACLLLSV